MQFSSYIFILLFLPLCVGVYLWLGRASKYETAKLWLIGMSLWFYAYLHVVYLLFLIGSILVNYTLVCLMKNKDKSGKKLLILDIVLNIGVLFLFKYFNFFVDNINSLSGLQIPLLKMLIPAGLSFITFQQLSFVIDNYKDNTMEYSFIDYVLYIAFFPKISSGPITPFGELNLQLQSEERKRINYGNLSKGFYQFAMGLAKKVLIADTLEKFVNIGFSDINDLYTISALIVMLCYTLQLYYDFSGYSDMAIGIARMMNIDIPINFNSPYKACSVTEFWKRWHITLTRFFTKYVYIPLGGSRKGTLRTCINIMIIFFLSGLWHGANWTFIVWGLMHGALMVIERLLGCKGEKKSVIGWIFTFLFVNAAWVIFRADTLMDAIMFFGRIFHVGTGAIESSLIEAMNGLVEIRIICRMGLQGAVDKLPYLPAFVFGIMLLLFTFASKNTQEKVEDFCFSKKQMVITVLFMFWSIISLSGVNMFLYSNF